MSRSTRSKDESSTYALIAGSVSGMVEAMATYPTEYVKTVMQLQSARAASTASSPSLFRTVSSTFRSHGIMGFYR